MLLAAAEKIDLGELWTDSTGLPLTAMIFDPGTTPALNAGLFRSMPVTTAPPTTGPASEAITYSYAPNTTFPGDGPGLGNAGLGERGHIRQRLRAPACRSMLAR